MAKPGITLSGTTLLTGATGFIGHYILAQLLERGERCVVLLRSPLPRSVARLKDLLAPISIDLELMVAHGRLGFVEGRLGSDSLEVPRAGVTRIVHCAGVTRLDEINREDTLRTNLDGSLQLLNLADQFGVRELHMVSSAYRCGRMESPIVEDHTAPPSFHNTYERSKCEAENAWRDWGETNQASVTIYRPSIVVGDRSSGRVTRTAGIYLFAKATKMLAEAAQRDPAIGERRVPLLLGGHANSEQNLVPVDYVAKMVACAVLKPSYHGRTYHLTHPSPPTNAQIKEAIEQAFDLSGGQWGADDSEAAPRSVFQEMFEDATGSMRPYLENQPRFDRRCANALEREAGLACPSYTVDELAKLFLAADRMGWGKRHHHHHQVGPHVELLDRYFFTFLPEHIGHSEVAKATRLTCTMRFQLVDVAGGDWACEFVHGALTHVFRPNADKKHNEDFTYLTTSNVFWTSICGEADPQSVFLDGLATIHGDLEKAMKMAVILREFNTEFPCTEQLLRESSQAVAC